MTEGELLKLESCGLLSVVLTSFYTYIFSPLSYISSSEFMANLLFLFFLSDILEGNVYNDNMLSYNDIFTLYQNSLSTLFQLHVSEVDDPIIILNQMKETIFDIIVQVRPKKIRPHISKKSRALTEFIPSTDNQLTQSSIHIEDNNNDQ
jgi:hypothetical protein